MYGHDPARATEPPTILVVTGCTGGTPQGTVEGSGNIIQCRHYYMGLVATKPVVGGSDKARLKPVSSATETS